MSQLKLCANLAIKQTSGITTLLRKGSLITKSSIQIPIPACSLIFKVRLSIIIFESHVRLRTLSLI